MAEVVHEDESLRVTVWSRLIVNRWYTTPSKAGLDRLAEIQQQVVDSMPDRRVMVTTIIAPQAGILPDAPARASAERLAREGRDALIGLAQVVEGTGFTVAATRAVMSGVLLAVRAGYPIKIFGTVADAQPWVEERLRIAGYDDIAEGVVPTLRAA